MGHSVIEDTPSPATTASITQDLHNLGVRPGQSLIVHSSLRTMGWVVGGAGAVVDALCNAVGSSGTLTMPSHSGDWSNPAHWVAPPVPEKWWDSIIRQRPAFDPYKTPMRSMGAVPENLLLRRETLRSSHPLHSHMAWGRHANQVTEHHQLKDSFGDTSPLGRLYELDAQVVLIGVNHDKNTSLHLAESRAEWVNKPYQHQISTVLMNDVSTIVEWSMLDYSTEDFVCLGDELDKAGLIQRGRVGLATAMAMSMRDIVDFATTYFSTHR